jgi:NAD(P)-dependent dehydrogenase (short-subunit alcohol dehydrogenase family)
MRTLHGKMAVVTGAGNGIGRGIALALADAGTHVVVSDIRTSDAEAVAAEARERGVRAIAVTTDVAQRESVAALADRAFAEFGSVDILVNNAGVNWRPFRTVLDASMEDWNFILNINLWGVVHGLDAFLPRMAKQQGDKHIVNTSSQGGIVNLAGMAPYVASKAAVAAMSEAMAQELAPHGFGVTILCPGAVRTEVGKNSEALRSEADRKRSFKPFNNPVLARFEGAAIEVADVGKMVINAILDGTLYLHTHPFPPGIPEERMERLFGPGTLGRT